MENEKIEAQYKDLQLVYDYLMQQNEVSFASSVREVYKKTLLLSAASYFEYKISSLISKFAQETTTYDKRIVKLVELKILDRQYHTLFEWERRNTNSFWKLFGEETKLAARQEIDSNTNLKEAELSFLQLGHLRNLLVHKNFAEHDVNVTVDEVYKSYKSACNFISLVEKVLGPSYLKKEIKKR